MAKEAGKLVGVLLIYALTAVLLTWPVITDLGGQIAGSGGDAWQTLWRLKHKSGLAMKAWEEGNLAGYFGYEFGGRGEPRLVNLSNWPWAGIYFVAGSIAGYNIIWLLSYILGGWGVYLLVKELTAAERGENVEREGKEDWPKKDGGALLAGLFFMMLPFHEAHSFGHFGAMQIQWLPLIIYSLIKWWKRTGRRWSAVLAILVTVQAWTEHHYALWLLVMVMLGAIMYGRELKEGLKQKNKIFWGVVIAWWLALSVLVPYWPTMKLFLQDDSLELGPEQTVRFSADALAWIVPAPFHTLWGNYSYRLAGQYFTGNTYESTLYLGIASLLLVVFFRQKIPEKQRRFWTAAAIVFGLISLGPRLHILGKIYGFPLPYAAIDSWPVFGAVRAVARAGMVVGLAMAVLLGWVVKTQVKRSLNLLILAGVIVFEFMMWPVPRQSATLPEIYRMFAELPGRAVIEIPAATNYAIASRALYGSTKHGKQSVGNIALERAENPEVFKEVRSLPALRQILFLKTEHLQQGLREFMNQDMAETLADTSKWVGAGAIVVHHDSLNENQKAAITASLEGQLGLQKETIGDTWLYRLDGLPKGDGVFSSRDERWLVMRDKEGKETAVAKDEAAMWIYNGNEEDIMAEISWEEKEGVEKVSLMTDLDKEGMADENGRRGIRVKLRRGKNEIIFKKSGSFEIYNPELQVR